MRIRFGNKKQKSEVDAIGCQYFSILKSEIEKCYLACKKKQKKKKKDIKTKPIYYKSMIISQPCFFCWITY